MHQEQQNRSTILPLNILFESSGNSEISYSAKQNRKRFSGILLLAYITPRNDFLSH